MAQVWNSESKKLEFEEWPREEETAAFGIQSETNARNDFAAYKEPGGYSGTKSTNNTKGDATVSFDPGAYVEAFPKSKAAKICESAAKLIDGPKHQEHGDRKETFSVAAEMWSTYLAAEITPSDVAWLMVLLKVARETNGHNPDNSVDVVGYAAIAGELTESDSGC